MLRHSRRDRGVTQTPFLIVAIIMMLIAILVAYITNNAKETAIQEAETMRLQRNDAEQRERALTDKLNKLTEVVGYAGKSGETGVADLDVITGELKRTNDQKIQPKIDGEPLTLENVLNRLITNLETARESKTSDRAEIARLTTEVAETAKRGQSELSQSREATAAMKRDKDALQGRFDKRVEQDEEQINTLRGQLEATRTQLEQEQGKGREAEAQFKEQLARLRTRITELTQVEERRTTDLPDGQVIRGLERDFDPRGEGYAFVYIDIGRKHGVKDGTKFEVFTLEKGGKRTLKGELVVKKALDDLAECAILVQHDERNPIVKGDFVQNPFFEKGAVQNFALVGTFDGESTLYTKEEWARIIKERGHNFQAKIMADTSFVILGTDYQDDSENWPTAQTFKVETVKENEVLNWFNYGTYKPREGKVASK
jgi:hypothetical protein